MSESPSLSPLPCRVDTGRATRCNRKRNLTSGVLCGILVNMRTRTVSDDLRDAIRASKLPLLQIEQKTGVQRASLSRFLTGKRSLYLSVVDVLAKFLHLELRPTTRRRK